MPPENVEKSINNDANGCLICLNKSVDALFLHAVDLPETP